MTKSRARKVESMQVNGRRSRWIREKKGRAIKPKANKVKMSNVL